MTAPSSSTSSAEWRELLGPFWWAYLASTMPRRRSIPPRRRPSEPERARERQQLRVLLFTVIELFQLGVTMWAKPPKGNTVTNAWRSWLLATIFLAFVLFKL